MTVNLEVEMPVILTFIVTHVGRGVQVTQADLL
jgi:hypothetical protein